MVYYYCCIYGEMVDVGVYQCNRSDLDSDDDGERCDVSCCGRYIFDDQFYETPYDIEFYGKCYLKDICVEKCCER